MQNNKANQAIQGIKSAGTVAPTTQAFHDPPVLKTVFTGNTTKSTKHLVPMPSKNTTVKFIMH